MEQRARHQVDYRFLLANERTFLAWSRTALALQAGGLGVLQFLTSAHDAVRVVLGLALVAVGSYTGAAGYRRYRSAERAIRAGRELPAARPTIVIAGVVAAVPLVAAVVLAVT